LPLSARNLQEIRTRGLLDRGILSLFEIKQTDVQVFVAQLKVNSRNVPAQTVPGDPCVNGWNVWPKTSETFVPGNKELSGLKSTWIGKAVPIEALSCSSSKGDWLHIEIWSVQDYAVVKIYTDWN